MTFLMTSVSINNYWPSRACLAAGSSSKALRRNGKVSKNPVLWPWP